MHVVRPEVTRFVVQMFGRGIHVQQQLMFRGNFRQDFAELTLLAPEIVHTILTGTLPDNFSVDCLKQTLPVLWSEQKKLLDIK